VDKPAPPIAADVDVRDLDGFMLNVERLLASELVAIGTPEECWAALMLWCRAWKQVPGGSLPNDERILASFSGAGKRWAKVREVALHGFVLCSDGRLYHRFLCTEVQRAYQRKVAYQERRETDRKRLEKWRSQHRGNGGDTSDETRFGAEDTVRDRDGKKEEDSDASASGAGAPVDPVKVIWDRGLALIGSKHRSLLGKMRKEYGDIALLEAILESEQEHPIEPLEYLVACCQRRKVNGGSRNHASALDILARAAIEFDERQGNSGYPETPH
jgi:hypothetical protein